MLDLDQERSNRLAARASAAGHEIGGGEPIVWRGETIAVLPPEAPLAALAPLRQVDSEIALVIDRAMDAASGKGDITEIGSFLLQLLVTREDLPGQLISVARQMAEAVIGADGLGKFLAGNPSPWDIIALVRGALGYWGVTLGEASGSSDSSATDAGGPTSNPTSAGSTVSISAGSGLPPALQGTSASAAF